MKNYLIFINSWSKRSSLNLLSWLDLGYPKQSGLGSSAASPFSGRHLEPTEPSPCFLPVITVLPRGSVSHTCELNKRSERLSKWHTKDFLPRNLSEVDCHPGNWGWVMSQQWNIHPTNNAYNTTPAEEVGESWERPYNPVQFLRAGRTRLSCLTFQRWFPQIPSEDPTTHSPGDHCHHGANPLFPGAWLAIKIGFSFLKNNPRKTA